MAEIEELAGAAVGISLFVAVPHDPTEVDKPAVPVVDSSPMADFDELTSVAVGLSASDVGGVDLSPSDRGMNGPSELDKQVASVADSSPMADFDELTSVAVGLSASDVGGGIKKFQCPRK